MRVFSGLLLGGCILRLSLSAPALALSLDSPFLLHDEPLVVITAAEEGEPWLELPSGFKYTVTWTPEPLKLGQVRWTAHLPTGAPYGPWLVRTVHGRWVIIRLPPFYAVVELHTFPSARIIAGAQELVADRDGQCFLVFDWLASGMPKEVVIRIEDQTNPQYKRNLPIPTGPNQRTRVFVELLSPILSSRVVLPGHEFLLQVPIYSKCEATLSEFRINFPEGWEYSLIHCHQEGQLAVLHFKVSVPHNAGVGSYPIHLINECRRRCFDNIAGDQIEFEIFVSRFLPPLDVIGHWDLQKNDVDLTQPFAITYERALFASSLLGKQIPYTTEIMTSELLSKILQLWAESSQR